MTEPNIFPGRNHAPSYYAASAPAQPHRPHLEGDARADICIVGAGFTGMSAAMELVARGFRVVILEAERVGWGASGRNGGQLVNGYSRPLEVIGRRYGAAAREALASMALEGSRIIRERVAKHNIACDLVDGNFVAAFTSRQMRALDDERAVWYSHGHDRIEIIDRKEVREIVQTDRYVGGLLDHEGGHFHPLAFVLGEARVVEAAGGIIHERSRVVRLERSGGKPIVVTKHGRVTADTLLLCGNAYLGEAVPELHGRIMPVSSQIIATEPLGPLAAELLPAGYCVEDANYILDYFRRTADGRLLYGGGSVYGGRDPDSIEGKVRPQMLRTFPMLKDVRIDYAWSGNFALTLTRVPQIGQLAPGVLFSHGDSGHGVTTTQLLGRLLAEAVTGQLTRYDAFSNLPWHHFRGGQRLHVPLTMLGAWYYSLRDRLGI